MKVKDLKQLLSQIPDGMTEDDFDELDVLIPMGYEFDGFFKHPCLEDTGVSELGLDEDGLTTEPAFVIVPCGFYEEFQQDVESQLN